MSPSPREASVFADALERPAAERAAWLDQACAGEPTLRARVEALLAASASGPAYIDQMPTVAPFTRDDEEPGNTIGRYKLLEKLGEGGCGAVWAAEQREPVKRRVALKIIKLGMDTRQVIARFEAERQALALMDHPNIAKMLDAGATDTGRPFFVMELVRGIPITTYCDENNLSTQQRLELAIKVCHAIQHAHQKGIIHRDIKPSNVLITLHDAVPVPKVIDFGIAKATQQELTEKTIYTKFQQFIGTPAYMSPEQAEMSGLDIDTRSDVYSLGVLVYELVTGRTPFDSKELLKQGVDEIRRTIREKEPPRPSTRIATLQGDDLTTAARRRSTDARKLAATVRGDLDWVVMKCLEKDRTRRYDTATGLALDLQRFLGHEPVVARPPSAAYRTRKFIRRHRVGLAAAAAIVVLLVVGSITVAVQASRALHAERAQNELREAARQAEADAAAARRTAEEEKQRNEKIRWAREVALPEINRLMTKGDNPAAFELAGEVEKFIPKDPALLALWPVVSMSVTIETTPPGTDIFLKSLRNPRSEWERIGKSPLKDFRVARCAHRWMFKKEGFATVEKMENYWAWSDNASLEVRLDEADTFPPGMVRVQPVETDPLLVSLGDFWLDRFEVTNREFKEFVDRGGYATERYWKNPFFKDGHPLDWADAMKLLVDRSGRPGPATWNHGTYAANEADYPVTGVSWFEAAAFAEFAGKRLPSLRHWKSAGHDWMTEIVPLSNFGPGLSPVGRHSGVVWCGAYDMAGNAREWVWNETADGQRYILGGAVGDPDYMFVHSDRRPPFDRSRENGFRCMKFISPPSTAQLTTLSARGQSATKPREYATEKAVSNERFEGFRGRFRYIRSDLAARVESTDDTDSRWRKEKVSFAAAYGGVRLAAFIFFPRHVSPPYQAVVYFPGAGALYARSSEMLGDMPKVDALVATGRTVVYPIYEGTYERFRARKSTRTRLEVVESRVHCVQDVSRTIDYLETRSDFSPGKLAFAGYSWGAWMGTLVSAIDGRIKANVLAAGGFFVNQRPPEAEADPFNYAPHVKTPTLVVNGRDDYIFPVETSQKPFFNAIGTAPEHKRHVLYDWGHAINLYQAQADIVEWLDRYLGPVK